MEEKLNQNRWYETFNRVWIRMVEDYLDIMIEHEALELHHSKK